MHIAVLGNRGSWYCGDLKRAAHERGHRYARIDFTRLTGHVGLTRQALTQQALTSDGVDLTALDAIIVRTMPPGSLEQVVYRMDALARLESAGVVVVNPPKTIECAVDKYLTISKLAAAGLAGAHDFIGALPQGYKNRIGENGELLSGGQRQRLDLARTLLKGAPVLILDEPTSHLDADAEDRLRQALQRIRSDTEMTIIVVAHRLSTIALADRIVVLIDGRIEQIGSHEQLVAAGGWYANAYRKQKIVVDAHATTVST